MEDPGGTVTESLASPPAGAPKSKLDTLSKDDLIKFTKKQMAAFQKMKNKCADLEKEVEGLKEHFKNITNISDDSTLIQELTQRMDALLLEKAETQQSLALSRKELERTKHLAEDDMTELRRVIEDNKRTIDVLNTNIEESNSKHQEEIAHFQKLLKERVDNNREIDSERAKSNLTEESSGKCHPEEDKSSLEVHLKTLQAELEAIQERNHKEIAELQDSHQNELTEAQQEIENLKEELTQRSIQHEEELRALEEDCEIERERLLLLQEELTEQLALKDSYLQDVQEEDEEPGRSSGVAKMLALSACSQADSSHVDGEVTQDGRLKAALEDLSAQNTMLQDELTLLSNVKSELEAELERIKDEFQMEKEEMDFKINELQMIRESDPTTASRNDMTVESETNASCDSKEPLQDQNSAEQDTQAKLRSHCEALTQERDSALADFYHIKGILQNLETELGQKTNDFVLQYKVMKDQGPNAVKNHQDKTEQLRQENEELSAKVREITEKRNLLMETVGDLKIKLESHSADEQRLQSAAEKQTALAQELNQSVEKLTRQNEEILSQLQIKENMTEDLNEMVNTLTEARDRTQALLQLREEEIQNLKSENAKDTEGLLEEKQAAQLLKEATERELKMLKMEKESEIQVLKEERDEMEASLKEEFSRLREAISSSEMTIKDISSENACLHKKLEGTLTTLSQTQKEQELLNSKLATVEAQLEQQSSQKSDLEAAVNSLTEEAALAHNIGRELEAQCETLKNTKTEEMAELQVRVEELEKERTLLRSNLEDARGERHSEAKPNELQPLQLENHMLRANLEETMKDTAGLLKDLNDMKSLNEKMCAENQMLQEQINLMSQEKEEKVQANIDVLERERAEFRERLMDKDSQISQLRAEMAALQDSAAESASEENKSMEITQKIDELEKDNKEKDAMINKIKAVAVKAKKEVATFKEEIASLKVEREKLNISMKDIIHSAESYKNLQIDYDKQTEQLDKERENVQAAERQIADLTKHLTSAVRQVDLMSSEKEDLVAALETSRSMVKQIEAQIQDLQKQSDRLDRDLVAEKAMKEQKIKELSRAKKDVDELKAQLSKQQQQSQHTAQELEQLRKEAQQNSLLDMEMADYERLVKELNAKLSEKDECCEVLKAQITKLTEKEETLRQETETLKSQLNQEEEKTSKIKQLLVKSKKELADAKKQENSLALLQASLRGELEANQQQLESTKIEVCDLTTERHHLQDQLRSALEQQQRTRSSLQERLDSLQQERDIAKAELVATAEEFESYKVRVHNVLKQQKSKLSGQGESDGSRLEREQLLTQVDQLKSRLGESQQNLQSSTAELQQLQTEHDTLLERHNKILQENISKEADLRERLMSLQSENGDLRSELAQAQADSSYQIETQQQTHREQLRKLQDDHRATVETLQGQLTRVEEQLYNLQSQNSSVLVQSSRKSLDTQRRTTDQNHAGLGHVAPIDLQSMAREECEGMETTENESTSPSSILSLEHLLMSPDPKQEPFVWTVEPTKDELSHKLSTATRSLEHMNSLLHETEATNARLMEQINLLKSEVRRLERNQEREKSVANLEYLKNVLLQFIFLRSGSERQALLPVIHTMLQLSPDEKSKLAAIAQGEEEASGTRGTGWGSYLHSWSGIR